MSQKDQLQVEIERGEKRRDQGREEESEKGREGYL